MSGAPTPLSLSDTEDYEIRGHAGTSAASRMCPNGHAVTTHTIIVSKIGWIDQKGRVYSDLSELDMPFDGGSLTPLLVQKDCD